MRLTAEIRGMGFHPPAKAILEVLRTGVGLELVREASNKYDANAVQVWVAPDQVDDEDRSNLEILLAGYGKTLEDFDEAPRWMLGFVGKEFAAQIAPMLDDEAGDEPQATLSFSGAGKPQAEITIGEG